MYRTFESAHTARRGRIAENTPQLVNYQVQTTYTSRRARSTRRIYERTHSHGFYFLFFSPSLLRPTTHMHICP